MRTASFFILSIGLHAAALAYPAAFAARGSIEPIRVILLAAEALETTGEGGDSRNVGVPAKSTQRSASSSTNAAAPVEAKPATLSSQTIASPGEVVTANDGAIGWIEPDPTSPPIQASTPAEFLTGSGHGTGATTGEGTGNAPGNGNGAGWGNGSGAGSRSRTSGSSISRIQASYRDTPKPEYPETARREGHEGRVLLRVLIDDQGRTKAVEINTSSGSVSLDRAAAEAIRRWRFHPARYGDQPVESWLRIPIEFRLADANTW